MRALPSLRRPLAAALAAVALLPPSAFAAPWALKPGEYYSEVGGEFFSARTFLAGGDGRRLTLNGTLEQRSVRSHNEIGWKRHASVWLDAPFVSRTYASNTDGSVTSTGLGDIDLGLRLGMHVGGAPLALELGWTAPLGGNRRLFPGTSGFGGVHGAIYESLLSGAARDSSAFLDSGLQSLFAGLETGHTGRRFGWTLGGGLRLRYLTLSGDPFKFGASDRAASFSTASAGIAWQKSDRLILGAGATGEWSGDAGGRYGPAPRLLLVGPRVTYRVDDRTDVFAGTWNSEGGRNVLHIDQFYAGVAWKSSALPRLATALMGVRPH